MKKSTKVTLTVVAAAALAACSRRHPDPCEAATFNEQACQNAVHSGGYYYGGAWYPMTYHYPYPYYYDSYRTYVSHGGKVTSVPPASYGSGGVDRGGFGATGAAHGEAAGE